MDSVTSSLTLLLEDKSVLSSFSIGVVCFSFWSSLSFSSSFSCSSSACNNKSSNYKNIVIIPLAKELLALGTMVLKPGPARPVEPVEPDPDLKTGRFHALARFANWPVLARQTRWTRSKCPARPTRRAE
ncbi:hypothetical protein SLEP1_g44540 [Rubroshorea leprosula]|uniref:Uncharacterized protein n=1 Tax=Rubroshorea leprosula TaxID=152421 RepID=A0AAV5LHN4_9ROSI|nr:hypothetical protein SLEP1_g44540 [Rubroshorea leprosula]